MKRTFSQELSRLCEPMRSYPGVSIRLLALATLRGVRAGFIAYILRETTNAYARSPAEGQTRLIIFAGLFLCYQLFNRRVQRSDPFRFAFVSMVIKYCYETYLNKFFSLDQNHIEKLGTGKLISVIDKGMGTRADQLNLYVLRIPDFGFQLIVGAIVASLSHRSYGVGFLGFCIITIGIFWMTHQGGQQRRKRRMELQNERSRTLIRLLMNKIEVMQSHKTQYEITKLKTLEDDIQHIAHKKNKTSHGSYVIIAGMVNMLRVIVYLTVGYGLGTGATSRGDLIVGITIVTTLDAVMQQMRSLQTGRSFTLDSTRQMRDFFDETPLMQSGQHLPLFRFDQGNITLTHLTFGYEGKQVLQDFDLSLEAGKIYALVGPSGGGKTTIMKLIAGLLRPDSGTVMIDGQDIHQHDLGSYYSHIGYLTQEPSVFDGTVRENLLYGISKEPEHNRGEQKETEKGQKEQKGLGKNRDNNSDISMSSVDSILSRAQCQFVYDLPHGLDTEIGERGVRLSGGQRQRLAIAKIMLKNPEIILLDEPTSALDSVSEELVSQAMQELFKNRTVVIIAHRLQTVKHADRILYIDKITDDEGIIMTNTGSSIIESGTHDELISLGGEYAKMVTLQTSFG